jgi:hypothetical protein
MLDLYPFVDRSTRHFVFFKQPQQFLECFIVNFKLHNLCHLLNNCGMFRVRSIQHHKLCVLIRMWWDSYYLPQRLRWKASRGIPFYQNFLQSLSQPLILAHVLYNKLNFNIRGNDTSFCTLFLDNCK